MIVYLVTRNNSSTIDWYLEFCDRDIRQQFQVIYYEDLPKRSSLPIATYIFSDLERLDGDLLDIAGKTWQILSEYPEIPALLNHPYQSMRRYELLRHLQVKGINDFNIYRLTECRFPERFPVFIRGENDHRGNQSGLLNNLDELHAEIHKLRQAGINFQDKVIIEYCDVSDDEGVFRKYSAYVIGDAIFSVAPSAHKHWVVKANRLPVDIAKHDVNDQIRQQPEHLEKLREIYRIARIDYGRIDYSLFNGEIRAWEINTNPSIFFPKDYDPNDPSVQELQHGLGSAFRALLNAAPQSSQTIPASWQFEKDQWRKGIVERSTDWLPWLSTPQKVGLRSTLRQLKQALGR